MKIKLIDQLHISSVSADTMPGGTIVEVHDSEGKDLIKRKLATAAVAEKAAPKPANKARQTTKNK